MQECLCYSGKNSPCGLDYEQNQEKYMKDRIQKHRFTLIELLVVCGIILILAGIGVSVYSLVQRKMNDSRCHAMIAKMSIALENYKAKTGYYIQFATASALYIDSYSTAVPPDYNLNNEIDIPANEIGKKDGAPWSRGAWKDPWGREFRYKCPGTRNPMSFDLYSFGADKLSTGADADPTKADDISNWKQ
jgi:general secretion pathway protein G